MSFEHPNRNNESIRDVERDIMRRPPEHNTTNLDLDRMNLMLDVLGHAGGRPLAVRAGDVDHTE